MMLKAQGHHGTGLTYIPHCTSAATATAHIITAANVVQQTLRRQHPSLRRPPPQTGRWFARAEFRREAINKYSFWPPWALCASEEQGWMLLTLSHPSASSISTDAHPGQAPATQQRAIARRLESGFTVTSSRHVMGWQV
ncbi:hypothetical protein BJV78DRAFT_1158715 [Lactifluus subvellereus]|nr:hypothetical protein BJV78DRAFT_1158715 [Lactifluus subvellereus]